MERLLANVAGRVRRAIRDGREYLVAPLSLIVPGVLNGSKGALYYPPEEVADDPQKWDGMPLTLRHPFDELGRPVSARHPGVAARQYIGFIKNASANGKLRADGWFDIERLQALDSRILNSLLKGQPLELSTGLYTDNEPASGTDHKGRPYEYIARNYRPDHVAVLPDEVGACSIKDGCGVLVNHDKHPMDLTVNPSWVEDEDIWEKAKEAADKGDYDGDSYYAVVTEIYKKMGGTVGNNTHNSDPTAEQPLSKGYPETCKYCGSPTGVNPTTGLCIDCGRQNTSQHKGDTIENKRTLLNRIAELLGLSTNKDAEKPSEIDSTAPAKGLGKGNWSLGKRSNHAKALTDAAEHSSGIALENPTGHEEALKVHQDAANAHLAAYEEASNQGSTKGSPDYELAGYHKNKADYHLSKVHYHGAQALLHKNKIERGEAVATNHEKRDDKRAQNAILTRGGEIAGDKSDNTGWSKKADAAPAKPVKPAKAAKQPKSKTPTPKPPKSIPPGTNPTAEPEVENDADGYPGAINCYMGGGSRNMMSYNDAGSASTEAGMASMQTGHDGALSHSVEALGHSKGKSSKKAAKSHLSAAAAHEDEALRLRKDGYHDRAHEHDNAANMHRKAASLHMAAVTNSTGDLKMPLTTQQRTAIANQLVANGCACEEEKEKLLGLSDRLLISLNAKMTKDLGGDLDFQEGEEEDEEGLESEDLHSFDGPPKKTKARQAGGAGIPSEYNTNRMNLNSLPRDIREDIQYAREMKGRERAALLDHITANAADDTAKKTLLEVYEKMDLNQLRKLAAAMPTPARNTLMDSISSVSSAPRPHLYLPPGVPSAPTSNVSQETTEEWPPRINWQELVKEQRQAV